MAAVFFFFWFFGCLWQQHVVLVVLARQQPVGWGFCLLLFSCLHVYRPKVVGLLGGSWFRFHMYTEDRCSAL